LDLLLFALGDIEASLVLVVKGAPVGKKKGQEGTDEK
jgi:hypothetical protein